MQYRNFVLTVCALALVAALVPGISTGAAEEASTETPTMVLDLQTVLTDAPVTPMATLQDTLNMGPKPVGLCANNGCTTTCRKDADCGPGGDCIFTACI